MARNDLTAQRLREVLDYDPNTGIFTWKARTSLRVRVGDVAGCTDAYNRTVIRIDGRLHFASRLAILHMTGQWPKCIVDHINGNRQDNRSQNLRDTSYKVNSENQHAASFGSVSGLLGVSKTKSGKWRARIMVNRKEIHLGEFCDAAEAGTAYREAKRRLHLGCTL